MKKLLPVLAVLLSPTFAAAEGEHVHSSPYAGQEQSLSADDIAALETGAGLGLAKAAELNGMPGPSHVLTMKTELHLNGEQEDRTRNIFQRMRREAIAEGKRLVAGEQALESAFRERSINHGGLREHLRRIEASRAKLRYIHLAAHLAMLHVLSVGQIDRYNELRGYSR
ncbi:hypothetical protein [Sinorhizobium meliloti]|uniref:Periplasmic heavy metal sensor n=1 Tax=Rhizobium meliloti (strain 1021) TaxID=266834 RepID=Q92ZE0_RHIME|nr:hypothetical protein [Sinorhizobium meliloti]AAK65204.1 hypothetical protein SMa1010 [Sinorhizobium meliloti 1021]AGG70229.1 Hypothetical protein SM2011_a1010 [Sinorhizobium meliloti 2011]ASP60377.1 hypothetical protein CDO30_18720 [Sinorhizobium meliloti]MCK3803126.1 hypothetical protein [Sinorhizobium meliloti]MCK3808912.1 hypothetical protein [Sinorhizobium meliloti]